MLQRVPYWGKYTHVFQNEKLDFLRRMPHFVDMGINLVREGIDRGKLYIRLGELRKKARGGDPDAQALLARWWNKKQLYLERKKERQRKNVSRFEQLSRENADIRKKGEVFFLVGLLAAMLSDSGEDVAIGVSAALAGASVYLVGTFRQIDLCRQPPEKQRDLSRTPAQTV